MGPMLVRGNNYDMYPAVDAQQPSAGRLRCSLYLLGKDLQECGSFTPLCLNMTGHLPVDSTARAKWIHDLKNTPLCDSPFRLFYYHQGGNLPTVYWVWNSKCNGSDKKEIRHQNELVIADLVQHFPQTATRLQLKAIRIEMNRIHSSPAKHNVRLKATLALVNPSLANTAITGQLQTSLVYRTIAYIEDILRSMGHGGQGLGSSSDSQREYLRVREQICGV